MIGYELWIHFGDPISWISASIAFVVGAILVAFWILTFNRSKVSRKWIDVLGIIGALLVVQTAIIPL